MSDYAHPEVLVSTDWVAQHAGDANVRVVEVDVDTAAYNEGHVPGSLNIPHMATLPRGKELARDRPILFICKSGPRSAVAAEFAATLGLTDLYNVEGGHDAWAKAGYPMEE